jgi:sugar lactone lactonase YvrE
MLFLCLAYLHAPRLFRFLACVYCILLLGGAAAPAFAGTSFGAVAVGASSGPVTVTVAFSVSGTLRTVTVVTQGTTGLDFQPSTTGGDTCAVGTTYASGQSCTVNVVFSPKGVGLRIGAVVLSDGKTPLAVAFLSGIGNGGLLNFLGGQIAIGSGLNSPAAVAVDAAGNVYIADNGNGRVVKVPVGGGTQTTISSGLNHPSGVAVDGAGDVYIADSANDRVLELPAGSGAQTTVGTGLTSAVGIAVDGAGNLYIADGSSNRVVVVPVGGGAQTTVGSGLSNPLAVAVDAVGNVYIADTGNVRVVMVPVGSGTQTTVASGLTDPTGVAVDAAGDVYITEETLNRVAVVPAAGSTQTTIGSGFNSPFAVAADGAGNVYIADTGNDRIVEVQQTALGFTLDLGTATVGGPTVANNVFFSNIGNIPVTLSNPTVTSPFTTFNSCGPSIAAGASCTVTVNFAPTAGIPSPGTTVAGTLTLTDSAPNSPQSIALTGQAIQVPTQLAFGTPPFGSIMQGGNAGTVTVKVLDSFGNLVPYSGSNVTLIVTGPSGYTQNYSMGAVGGVSTFDLSSAVLSVAGSYSYGAVSTFLTSANATEMVLTSAYAFTAQTVGVASTATTVTLAFNTTGTLGAVKVVTQGATGLDFQQSTTSGGTCAVGTTYASGQSCTVNVVFTPKGIGLRMGAVLLYDTASTPNLLATAFLSGAGNGGLLNFSAVQTTIGGLSSPGGVSVDQAGNIYSSNTSNHAVVVVPATGGKQTTIGTGLIAPEGVAVDGAGNVYIADNGTNNSNSNVFMVPAGGGPETPIASTTSARGVAVDGAGNVYIADSSGVVIKVQASGGAFAILTLAHLISPWDVAVDGAGNVYIADRGGNSVVVLPVGGGAQTTVGSGLNSPDGVAVDGAGNVYIADSGNHRVIVVPVGGGAQATVGTGLGTLSGVAVDGVGNVYIADSGNNRVVQVQQTQLPQTLNLGSVTVGGAPGTASLPFTNIGNAPLALSSAVSPNQYTESDTCSGSVAVNASCTLNLSFAPTTGSVSPGTTVSGTLTLTDNAPNSPQAISLTAAAIATPPTITTQPTSQTINSGQTANLTVAASGTSPLTYQWYQGNSGDTSHPATGGTGNAGPSYQTPPLTAITSYWVRVSNSAGSADSNTATITVITPPTITTQPISVVINSGQTATLTVAASGTSPFSYQWYQGNSGDTSHPVTTGGTGASYTTLTATTNYWVRVSNAAGSADSSTATVTVITSPTITAQPANQAITAGQKATLTVVASGTSPFTYQWYQGTSPNATAPIVGATTSSLTTPALTATTNYWVQVSNPAGSANSGTATITVITPPTITTQPISAVINSGQTATLTVAASGISPFSYQWYQGNSGDTNNLITGATGSSYTTPPLTTGANYWVRVSDSAGTADSTSQQVTVIAPTPPATFPGQSSNTQLTLPAAIPALAGTKVTLTCMISSVDGQTVSNTDPAAYGIACIFPAAVLLSTSAAQIPITIQTTGPSASASIRRNPLEFHTWYALTLPLSGFMFLGFGTFFPGAGKRRRTQWMSLLILGLLLPGATSCGGHFTPPTVNPPVSGLKVVTPPGSYYITIAVTVVPPPPGFVQYSLIVPLVVVPTSH